MCVFVFNEAPADDAVGDFCLSHGPGMSVTNLRKEAGMAKARRRWTLLLAFFLGAGLIGGGWAWWTDRRYKSAMEEIEAEIKASRYGTACRKLSKLLSWKSDPKGGIVYLLGSCELARGRNQAADEAWARVVPGSAFSERAIRGRLRLFHDSGQLAAAERLIVAAAVDPRNDRTALMALLVPTYQEQARLDEAERLIEARWEHLNALGEGALEPAIKLVRLHIELTVKAIPVETTRAFLDQAARLAPDDDRVWLGRANLAIETGAFDEAERWLDACLRLRPEDVPVWRARLSWGVATNRVGVVKQAMTHLPAPESSPTQVHRLNAWLAANRRDIATERRELERLLEVDPADLKALDRLAQLAERSGQPAQAVALRGKKAQIDRLRTRFEKLHERKQPIRDAVEMAHLAEQLGRRFEARAFLTLAISEEPDRKDLRHDLERLSLPPAMVGEHGRTPAKVLADVLHDKSKIVVTPSRLPHHRLELLRGQEQVTRMSRKFLKVVVLVKGFGRVINAVEDHGDEGEVWPASKQSWRAWARRRRPSPWP
jgi:tetratricopeptide (TPR) repeat protein